MIYRFAQLLVQTFAEQFPAVLIVGARQCGKTTLARHFLRGTYFDLEKPSDYQVFAGDVELALGRLEEPLILDEAQAGAEIDLVIERGGQRLGYEFKCASSVSRSDASGLKAGLADGVVTQGAVVYFGTHRYDLDDRIEAVPAETLLAESSEPFRGPS
ncbi:MAG: hypothetical protein FJ280_23630 [Planctomycetes bacterium]|nr:hypothetical protein [Planctomycetota bacterium]